MIFDLKIPKIDPTPEEIEMINKNKTDKKNHKLKSEKLF